MIDIIVAMLFGIVIGIVVGSAYGLYKVRKMDKKMKKQYQKNIKEAVEDDKRNDSEGGTPAVEIGESGTQDKSGTDERTDSQSSDVQVSKPDPNRVEIPKRPTDSYNWRSQ